jgi:putative FmdB family regulatory protein
MPTYEYKCTSCGHTFEAVQSMIDKPLSRCPKCKSAVRRVINGGIGIIFKGSGFYSTDYKKSSSLTGGNGKKAESSGSSESSSKETKDSSSKASSSGGSSKEKAAAS